MTSRSEEKWRPSNCFQSREQVVVPRGQIRRMGWVIKTLEAQIGQFLLGCQCPVSRGLVVQVQDSIGDIPAGFFFKNVLPMHQQRWIILCVDSLAIWRIINEKDNFLIRKNRGEKFSNVFWQSEILGPGLGAISPLHWLLICLQFVVT